MTVVHCFARWVRPLVVTGGALLLVQACGRSELGDYEDGFSPIGTGATSAMGGRGAGGTAVGRGGVTASGATSSTGGKGAHAGAPPTGGTSTGGAAIVGGATSTGGASPVAGTTSAGGAITGGVAGMGEAGVGPGGAPPTPTITCGAVQCDPDRQSCCVDLSGPHCISSKRSCTGATLGCTTNSDCAGQGVCCISITGDADAASSCKARCDFAGSGRDRQLCNVDADCQPPFRYCRDTIFGISICTIRP